MARGVNRVILLGNVGNDPDVRQIPTNGSTVVNFSLATSESWRDKNTGNQETRTEWHRCVAFGKLADIISEYVRKGSKIYVEGQLRTRRWEKDGVDMYTTEIVASEMQMLDSRGCQQNNGDNNYQNSPQSPAVSQPVPGNNQAPDFIDDIPF